MSEVEIVNNVVDTNNDDEVISYTQKIRKKVADRLTDEGIPQDTETLGMLLSTLDGLSKTAIQRKRIGVDEAANETSKVAAHAINNVLATFGERDPFKAKEKPVNNLPAPDLARLPSVNEVPGEVSIGVVQDNYENFTGEYQAKNPR